MGKLEEEYIRSLRQISERLAELEADIGRHKVRLEIMTDFEALQRVVISNVEIGEPTAVFDERCCRINETNGFWIKGTNQTGEIVHIQAVRSDDLTGSSLAHHWLNNPELYAPPGHDVVIEKSDFETAPVSHTISGKVCYHGDLWLHKSCRKAELASLLANYSILMGLKKFSPDFVYALIKPRMVERGWAVRAGFLHIHPWAPRWYIRGETEFYDDYLVWASGPELLDLWAAGKRNFDVLSRINVTKNTPGTIAKHMAGQ